MLIYLCEDSESDALRLKHHLNTYATKHHCNMEILLFSSGEEMIQYYKGRKALSGSAVFRHLYE
mgnify:CR=1 FL=1